MLTIDHLLRAAKAQVIHQHWSPTGSHPPRRLARNSPDASDKVYAVEDIAVPEDLASQKGNYLSPDYGK